MIPKVETHSLLKHLICSECAETYPAFTLSSISTCCQAPLLADYDYQFSKENLNAREWTMWRYSEMLPVRNPANIISLGEGATPIIPMHEHFQNLTKPVLLKDESKNPTGSFKARGISAAVSKAKELGVTKCIMPSAGNAGVAMSAYCTKAGMEAVVLFPRLTPSVYIEECHAHGARVILVDGLINDCAIKAKEINRSGEYFDLSTLKEPYRIEGKKTMGYEIAESLNWKLPDVIVYPTGGGTGLIGIWKAFKEMQELGWIGDYLPKMVSVQSENCRPVVDHWEGKRISISTYQPSIALGLNVPLPFGKNLIMKCLRVSKGTAIAVSEADIKHWMHKIWQKDGILTSPEGASALAGISKLAKSGFLKPDDQVLMLSTGGGLKHLIEE